MDNNQELRCPLCGGNDVILCKREEQDGVLNTCYTFSRCRRCGMRSPEYLSNQGVMDWLLSWRRE